MDPGPAEGLVREFLEPFADELLPGALDGYALPEGDGTERNRANITQGAGSAWKRPAGPFRTAC